MSWFRTQYRIPQGLKLEQYLQYMGMTMDQFKEQFREQADKQVKMRLAMEAIVAKESIEATEEEFEAEIKRIADATRWRLTRSRAWSTLLSRRIWLSTRLSTS